MKHTTSRGKYRRAPKYVNEDYKHVDRANNLYIIADGLGGYTNGDVASMMAVNSLAHNFTKMIPLLKPPYFSTPEEIQNELNRNIKDVNSHIYTLSSFSPHLKGFKTTIAAVFLHEKKAYVSSVGDSRVYLQRQDDLEALTPDDKYIQLEEGLTADEQLVKNRKAPMTQSIGNKEIVVHSNLFDLLPEDKILMVTDGITDYVHEDEIKNILKNSSFNDVCRKINNIADNPKQMLQLMSNYGNETPQNTMKYIRRVEKGDNRTIIAIYATEVKNG